MSEHSSLIHHNSSKSRQKFKEVLGKSREFESICLNQSQLKHIHSIRPYCSKQRKSSRRDSRYQSPAKLSRSKSKRLDNSSKKPEDLPLLGSKQLSEMYGQLISLKSEYKVLKANYNKLMIDKNESLSREQLQKKKIQSQLDETKSELERMRRNNGLLEKQIERIKKECIRLVEMERFKTKKIEETLQQKELMIAFLRSSLDAIKQQPGGGGQLSENHNSTFFIQNSLPISFDYFNKQHLSSLSQINHETSMQKDNKNGTLLEQDSLSFSRDKSKETDSIMHSFLSHDQSLISHNFIKKENILINSLNESPIPQQIEVIDEISEKSEKSMLNPQPCQFQDEKRSFSKIPSKSSKSELEKHREVSQQHQKITGKNKINTKRLQISIIDENVDTNNLAEELQTKKKSLGSGFACRQKKKMTAKKSKQN